MQRFARALFVAASLLLAVHRLPAKELLRVAVIAPSGALADQIASEISRDENLAVVERSQIDWLLREEALRDSTVGGDLPMRAGRMLGVDAFLQVRTPQPGEWRMEIIDGASTRLLASGTSPAGSEGIDTARRLLDGVRIPRRDSGVRVAVTDFNAPGEDENVPIRAIALQLAAQLRTGLSEDGLTILDRTATAQVSDEQSLAAGGLTQKHGTIQPMLGADRLVCGSWLPAEKTLRLSVLDLANGTVVADATFPFEANPVLSETIMRWVLTQVAGKAAAEKYTWTPSVAAEALIPFYRGVTLFQQGRPLEATVEFENAYRLDDKFEEAFLWEARCYEEAGLQPLAVAERRFVNEALIGEGISGPATNTAAEGITFLGVIDPDGDAAADRKLEVLITDAAARTGQRVLLPANIAALRDEYDVLVGTPNSRGVMWDQAPGFLTQMTLSGVVTMADGKRRFRLQLTDTVRGRLMGKADVELGPDAHDWQGQVGEMLSGLLVSSTKQEAAWKVPMVELPSAEAIVQHRAGTGNVRALQLALRDPAALADDLQPLQKQTRYLADFLNFGLREFLLGRLPKTHPRRAWLLLAEIDSFLPFHPEGAFYSARTLDAVAELERFSHAHPDDAAGAVAGYILLWETMSRLPYPELEKRCDGLSQRLRRFSSEPGVGELSQLAVMSDHLRQIALVAQDDPARRAPLPPAPTPNLLLPKPEPGGGITWDRPSDWVTDEWHLYDTSPQDSPQEARAAIALMGRGRNSFKVDPRWLRDYPRSMVMQNYVIKALREVEKDNGLPILHPLDEAGERAAYHDMVVYAYEGTRRRVAEAGSARELTRLLNYNVREFLTNITHPGYRRTVPDTEFETMRAALAREADAAEKRLGEVQPSRSGEYWLPWREITRATSPFADQKYWGNDQGEIYDFKALDTLVSQAEARSEGVPLFKSPWHGTIRRYEFASLSDERRSAYYLAQFPKLQRDYDTPDLTMVEVENFFKFALTLFNGGHYPEAEALLRRIHDTPESDLNRNRRSVDLRANAAFHLAAIAQHDGRGAEASRLYKEVLAAAPDRPIEFMLDGAWRGGHTQSLQACALRLLSDVRETGDARNEAGAVREVRVRQKGYFPGDITFFYRIPPGDPPKGKEGYRVLLVMPSINLAGQELCQDDSTWARFADAHGWCLVVPRFVSLWTDPAGERPWGIEATMAALREIGRLHPIRQEGLLVHGYGQGGTFAHRLAMWKPGLCAAVSAHSAVSWSWEEALPEGMHPLSDLHGLPMLVTCGEEEDERMWNRRAFMERFVTAALGAAVPVTWEVLPHTGHPQTAQMEQMAQAFLARAADGQH